MWFLLLLLQAAATSGEVNSKARQRTSEIMAYDLQLHMDRVLHCLLPYKTGNTPSSLERMADRIQLITAALRSLSSARALKKILDEMLALHGFLKAEFQQILLVSEPVAVLNGTKVQLCEPLEQETCMSHQLCSLGRMLKKTSRKLEELIVSIQKTNAITVRGARLKRLQYNVLSGPFAYILRGRSQSESHHCILEMEGWGFEDPGFSVHRAYIKINGRALVLPARRGVFIISMKFQNQKCIVDRGHSYDTFGSEGEANALDVMLKSLPYGAGIAAVTNDEFTYRLHRPADTLMKQYGIYLNIVKDSNSMWVRSSAAWFGVKGHPSQARVKQYSRRHGPAKLFVDSMDVKFSPWGKGFVRYPGTEFVGDKFTMIKAATRSDHDCITRCAVSRGCKTVNVLDQGGQKLCHMLTARRGYPTTSQRSAGYSTIYELAYIP